MRLNEILFEKRKDFEFVKKAIQNRTLYPGSKGDASSVGVIGGDYGNTFIRRGEPQYVKPGQLYVNPYNAGPVPPFVEPIKVPVKVPVELGQTSTSTSTSTAGETGTAGEPNVVTGTAGGPLPDKDTVPDETPGYALQLELARQKEAARQIALNKVLTDKTAYMAQQDAIRKQTELSIAQAIADFKAGQPHSDADDSKLDDLPVGAFANQGEGGVSMDTDGGYQAAQAELEKKRKADAAQLADQSQIERRNAMEAAMAEYLKKKQETQDLFVAAQLEKADAKRAEIQAEMRAALITRKQAMEAKLALELELAAVTAASDERFIDLGKKYADKLIKDGLEDMADTEYAVAIEAQLYADIRAAAEIRKNSEAEKLRVMQEKLEAWQLEQAKIEVTNQDRVNALVQGDPDDNDAISVLTVAEIRSLIDRQAREKVKVNIDDFSELAVWEKEANKIVNPGDRFNIPKSVSEQKIEKGWDIENTEVGSPITNSAIYDKNRIIAARAQISLDHLNKQLLASGIVDANGNMTAMGKGLSEGDENATWKWIYENNAEIIGWTLTALVTAGVVLYFVGTPPGWFHGALIASGAVARATLVALGLLAVPSNSPGSGHTGRAPPIGAGNRPITSFPSNNFDYDFNTMTLADITAEIVKVGTEMRKPGGYTKELYERLMVLKKHQRIAKAKQRNSKKP